MVFGSSERLSSAGGDDGTRRDSPLKSIFAAGRSLAVRGAGVDKVGSSAVAAAADEGD